MDAFDLSNWVTQNGGSLSGVEIRGTSDGGRGLFASRALSPGDKIILLPQHLLVTGDVARASPAVSAVLRDANADGVDEAFDVLAACQPDETAIVLFLMAEKIRMETKSATLDEESEASGEVDWGIWMQSLPSEFITPCSVDEDVVEERLDGTYMMGFVFQLRDELQMLYEEWVIPYAVERNSKYFPKDSMSLELFLWAHSCVESRSFSLGRKELVDSDTGCSDETSKEDASSSDGNLEDDEKVTVLTPFADMMNHSCSLDGVNVTADAWWPGDEERAHCLPGFQMFVTKEVATGEELFISYSNHDNAMLLLHYGFAVSGNPNDKIPLNLEEPECLKQVMLLGLACDGKLDGLHYDLTVTDPLPPLLLATMRLLHLEGKDLEACTRTTDFLKPVSVQNERKALDALKDMVKKVRKEEISPRTAGTGTSLAAFEEFCDICVEGKNSIADLALSRLEEMQVCLEAE